jgi:hypothetical protein
MCGSWIITVWVCLLSSAFAKLSTSRSAQFVCDYVGNMP